MDYQSSWRNYSYKLEKGRFVSDNYMKSRCCQKLEICKTMSPNNKRKYYEPGGVPVIEEDEGLYVLDGHCAVEGETGSKKSRCITMPSIIASGLAGHSMVVLDPKGELTNDAGIANFLKEHSYEVVILDFREFNKNGWNFLSYPYQSLKKGRRRESEAFIYRFCSNLITNIKADDPYWNDQAVLVMNAWLVIILSVLADKKGNCGNAYANLSALFRFINKDKGYMLKLLEKLDKEYGEEHHEQIMILQAYYRLPENTYGCASGSIMALLKDFCTHQDLSKMLCADSFDPADLYRMPIAVFMVIPDESTAYNHIAGLIVDSIYEQLINEFSRAYQGEKGGAAHAAHFILDEFASLKINDMPQKMSAARSREIIFTLIYQVESQLESVYGKNETKTILGNVKNHIFLGSSSQETLERISNTAGKTYFKGDALGELLISADDLRKMEKADAYKDALVMREDILYTPRLCDVEYGVYGKIIDKFKKKRIDFPNWIGDKKMYVYTPEQLYFDLVHNNISGSR